MISLSLKQGKSNTSRKRKKGRGEEEKKEINGKKQVESKGERVGATDDDKDIRAGAGGGLYRTFLKKDQGRAGGG